MASTNRTNQISHILKVLKKHFQPVKPAAHQTVLEHLLFACCLENSPNEDAEAALTALKEQYFDWNEVRVSTVRELAESLKMLVDPDESAIRVKRSLQSIFESHYAFDLEPLAKENLGKAADQLAKYRGTTHFVVAYVTQAALGGHAIPVNRGLLLAFHVLGVITDEEREQGGIPGLERAVPKSKGQEVGSILHQFGVLVGRNPYSPTTRNLLLEIEPECKDRLPKRPSKKRARGKRGEGRSAKKKTAGKSNARPAGSPSKKKAKKSAKTKTSDRKKSETGGPRKKKRKTSDRKPAVKKTKRTTRKLAKSKPR